MEAILDGPIVVIKDPRTEKNRVIDPGHIGRQLMSFRQLEAQLVTDVSQSGLCRSIPHESLGGTPEAGVATGLRCAAFALRFSGAVALFL